MKTMRKLFTVLLALAMTLALAVPAFAADTTGSITITNPQGDRTYTAYKIFDVTYSGDHYSYTISDTDAAFTTVKAYADVTANGLTLTPVGKTGKYNVSTGDSFSAASFAQYLKTNAGSLGTGTAFTKDGDTMKASGLTPGYYFVSGTSGTVCELATAENIQIRDKNEVPEIKKDVNDDDRTVEVGQKLTYTITGKVPSTKGYTEYTYEVTDTMSEGLTFNNDVKVTIGGVDVTAAATIKNNENGFVASINMMKYQDQIDAPVVITYTATVNEKAIQRNEETNTATLKYSNNPADKNSFGESHEEVEVFSFNIVINKYAAGSESTKLEGAKFVLKNAENKYYKYDAATKAATWVADKADATEVTTDDKGVARFDGLQADTYRLEETAAPAGYNQLTKDITIVLNKDGSATIDDAASTPGAAHSLTAGVANSTGTMLPETGGIGTVIFVALGALAVICTGVFLVTNKRMSKESF
ncbi:SpaH/EbpB family LPXTG-anchored major pilin [Oscillospiraceae bacterium CLA-AA-H272]|jgi:fimbrial isopeptide formation D2 family protein/LPXTG-motif cell wall-anchored protein|uniref:SpaH/EbpB family LPXTG-anchored major pilin n=2 Tax=Brotocaccenecus cirricatena TaxID=3064195 RepID=A0AAE3AH45_9FIRM|nr:SpaH/EbpB family LPXTG-anchored major pilin [Brotocaccenecus cirricatena]